ncbi:hypothetical protein [Pararhodobacter aggregans]|uniref:hypothetical protein n=1 Tax=Pararhodobacter aggregans TaxID=404875 RepID=UPI003A8E3A9B
MDAIGRRDLLSLLGAVGGAAALSGLPEISIAQSRDGGLTITFGGREIEIIIPFFPRMPPRGDMIEVELQVNARRGAGRYRMSIPARQVAAIAEATSRGIRLSARGDSGRVSGEFTLQRDGSISGRVDGLRDGGSGSGGGSEVQAMMAPAVVIAGIAGGVAIVGIVAVVAVVAIISNSGGGNVTVTADTPAGDVDVEVEVGR